MEQARRGEAMRAQQRQRNREMEEMEEQEKALREAEKGLKKKTE